MIPRRLNWIEKFNFNDVENIMGDRMQKNMNNLLIDSIKENDMDLIEWTIERGAEINPKEANLLAEACSLGNFEIVKCLVENGAEINADNALALAKAEKHSKIREYLIENGGDLEMLNY